MIFILLGVPGSGKGTLSDSLISENNFKHISTGDVFRKNIKNETKLGKEVKKLISEGNLVSDEITNAIATEEILNHGKDEKLLLDGYPRTIDQANFLENFLSENGYNLQGIVYLHADKDVVIKRISSRLVSENGKTYNLLIDNISESNGDFYSDDGEKLIRRPDDRPDMVKRRFDEYVNKTSPLVEFYESKDKFHLINANSTSDEVYTDMIKYLSNIG